MCSGHGAAEMLSIADSLVGRVEMGAGLPQRSFLNGATRCRHVTCDGAAALERKWGSGVRVTQRWQLVTRRYSLAAGASNN